MNLFRRHNLPPVPTSRTLAVLSCALALLMAAPGVGIVNGETQTTIRTLGQKTAEQNNRIVTSPVKPTAQPVLALPKVHENGNTPTRAKFAADPWQLALLKMRVYLAATLAVDVLSTPDLLTEVPAVFQLSNPATASTLALMPCEGFSPPHRPNACSTSNNANSPHHQSTNSGAEPFPSLSAGHSRSKVFNLGGIFVAPLGLIC